MIEQVASNKSSLLLKITLQITTIDWLKVENVLWERISVINLSRSLHYRLISV